MSSEIDDEMLVAFLDGELTGEDHQKVANSLEVNEELQARVSALEQTWALVGELPEVKPNADLAQSTLELVTLEIEKENATAGGSAAGWLRGIALAAMVGLLVYMLGSVVGKRMTASYQDLMLSNLDLLAEYSALREIDSPEWIEKLAEIDGLTEAFPGNGISDEIVPDNMQLRSQWLDQLEVVELGRLRDNVEGLRKETDERRQVLRETLAKAKAMAASESEGSSDASGLPQALAAARAYERLLQTKSSMQADQIKSIEDLDQRAQRVRELVHSRLLTKYASEMPAADRDAIDEWVQSMRGFMPLMELTEFDFLDESVIREEDLVSLRRNLTAEAQALLENIDNEDATQLRLAISFWVDTVVNPERMITSTPEQLQETLTGLNADRTIDEYYRIQMLPEDQARQELRQRLGVRDAETD